MEGSKKGTMRACGHASKQGKAMTDTVIQHEPSEQPRSANGRDAELQPAANLRLDNDHDLSRVGFWSLALGGLGFAVGVTFLLAGGILPGALVAAVGLICALTGALTLALVAHHQG
jgi:hypothetical protein